jgi:hypothetical protein
VKLFPTDSLQGIGQVLPNGSVHRLERHPHPEGGNVLQDISCRTCLQLVHWQWPPTTEQVLPLTMMGPSEHSAAYAAMVADPMASAMAAIRIYFFIAFSFVG